MITYTVKVDEDKTKRWYLNDKLHREDGPAVEWANGTKRWYLKGKLHREDGPAIEYACGSKSWYLNGKLHREDGPAIEETDGTKYWYLNGNLHREDGPAVEYADGTKYWYLNDKELTEEDFNAKIKKEVAYVQPNIMSLANKIEKETLKGLSENDIISVCETIIENVYRNMRK
jgi:hypothetical protein